METQLPTPTRRPRGNPNWVKGVIPPENANSVWKPGQSGNPRGRTPDPIIEMARTAAPAIFQRLIDIAMGKIDDPVATELAASIKPSKDKKAKNGTDVPAESCEPVKVWKTPLVADQIRAAAFVIERGFGKSAEVLPDGTTVYAFYVPKVAQSTEEWEAAHSSPDLSQ